MRAERDWSDVDVVKPATEDVPRNAEAPGFAELSRPMIRMGRESEDAAGAGAAAKPGTEIPD